MELPDGDFLDLDWASVPETDGAPAPLVVLLHGLEGSARSSYALQAYRALGRRGVATVGLNFRGCSGEPNRLSRMYHSGETGDLRFVLRHLRERFPRRPLGALGFSVGGNVLLKYLGELGGGNGSVAPAAAATVSVPFDLSLGADWIERGFSRTYRSFLVRKLHRKVRLKADRLRSLIDVDRVLATRTFREFDDLATAPVHGFAGAEDYYRRSSSSRFVERIRTPTLVIQSLDDPFLPPSGIPREELESNDSIELRLYGRGGHVGFVAGSPWRPLFWAEETAAAFLAQRLLGASRPAPARE